MRPSWVKASISGELRFTGHTLSLCFYALSSREPVSTSLENALGDFDNLPKKAIHFQGIAAVRSLRCGIPRPTMSDGLIVDW
ncbi:hypothetical protein CHELA40_13664 [Chelatococcus asaccharovorans]|nr:hypothetical protein CHELA40_13664 [Chelatococcus asaccharovorans]CAH1676483.1 hypothetical protein CHELA17_61961 [Chelatococcus asaccharovorans]